MRVQNVVAAVIGMTVVAEASVLSHNGPFSRTLSRRQAKGAKNGAKNGGNNNAGGGAAGGGQQAAADVTCLAAGALQTASNKTGQNDTAVADGQVNSKT